jgi:hypothetical protein
MLNVLGLLNGYFRPKLDFTIAISISSIMQLHLSFDKLIKSYEEDRERCYNYS